ncbi:MAG: hypothetical protein ACYTKC_16415 [Planctomycetota bacterium]
MRRQPYLLPVSAIALSLVAGLPGAPLPQDPPGADLPKIEDGSPLRFEYALLPPAVKPKFRVRDCEPALRGTSIFSKEMGDMEDFTFAAGGAVRAFVANETFSLKYWTIRADGKDTLPTARNWGGIVIPAGTPIDADIRYECLELDWRHRFELADKLWLDAGIAVEYLVFDADLGFGTTRLSGIYPMPRLTLVTRPVDWFEASVYASGFNIPFKNGDTDILDPRQFGVGVRVLQEKWSAGISWDLHHVHLEENSGDIDEDIVHSRLRGLTFSLRVQF